MLSSLMNTPVKLSRTLGIKHEILWHTFGLESFLWFLIELNSPHTASGQRFSSVTGKKGRQVTPPKTWMFYFTLIQRRCSKTWKQFKKQKRPMYWPMSRWNDWLLSINLRISIKPTDGNPMSVHQWCTSCPIPEFITRLCSTSLWDHSAYMANI